jgi:hypothetical protein
MTNLFRADVKWKYRAGATIVLALLFCTPVVAQQNWEQLPLGQLNGRTIQKWSELPNTNTEEMKTINDMLSGAQTPDAAKFDKFFNELVFPLFAQWQDIKVSGNKVVSPFVDGPGISSPPKMRSAFRSTFVAKATNSNARDRLNGLTLTKMDQIASGNFHPICRANAMWMIALLSQADPDTAWKPALPVLLKGVTAPTTIDAVRVPALAGLVRQARTGIEGDAQTQVTNAMLSLIKIRPAPGQASDGPDWIARRAIDVLAAIGSPGSNGVVTTSLLATVNDATASMPVRTAAAGALAKIPMTPQPGFSAKPWIDALSKLAIECYKAELNSGSSQRTPIVPERLKAQLGDVRQGLVGVDGNGGALALAAPPDKEAVKAIVTQLDNLIQRCNTARAASATPVSYQVGAGTYLALPPDPQKPIIEAVQKAGADFEAVVQRGGAPAPAAAPAAAPAGPGVAPVRPQPTDSPF